MISVLTLRRTLMKFTSTFVALLFSLAILSPSVSAQSTSRSDGFGGYRHSDGSTSRSDGFGGYRHSDGSTSRSDGFGGYRHSK